MRPLILILKLPAHTTDLLQPVDMMTCFGLWSTEKEMGWEAEHIVGLFGVNQRVTKAQFENLLSDVWHEG